MVRTLRIMSVERGEDPKDFTLVSFGGAGGLHVCALAEEMEMNNALVPVNAGVLSALGMIAADASRERSRTINKSLKQCDSNELENSFESLVCQAKEELIVHDIYSENKKASNTIKTYCTIDVRYIGQSHALNLVWDGRDKVEQSFHKKHKDCYGHCLEMEIEVVNVRVRVIEKKQSFVLPKWAVETELKEELISMPNIKKTISVINRSGLEVGEKINGPALIVEASATTWLAEGWLSEVDEVGSLRLTKD